jgi:hypothetical protein
MTAHETGWVWAQGGGTAESRVKLRHGDVLVVDSWAGRCQLGALRRFLGEGFQAHLQHNPLLHQARAPCACCASRMFNLVSSKAPWPPAERSDSRLGSRVSQRRLRRGLYRRTVWQ